MTRNASMRRANFHSWPCYSIGQGCLTIASKSGIWYKTMAKLAEPGLDEQQVQSDDKDDDDGDDINNNNRNDSEANASSGEEQGTWRRSSPD